MTFSEAVKSCFSKFADFTGRATRSEFWYFYLFTVLVLMIATIIDVRVFGYNPQDLDSVGPLSGIASLVFLVPILAVSWRRLHDIDKSGWWTLLWFILVIGWIPLFYWYSKAGDPVGNQYDQPA